MVTGPLSRCGAKNPGAHGARYSSEVSDPERATRAYHLCKQAKYPEGRDLEFWLKAVAAEATPP
jgi:hypothetical protein